MLNSQLLFILLIAMVAGVILFRLYTVLGRRTGHERPAQERYGLNRNAAKNGADNVVALPDRAARAETLETPADPLARGLLDIKLADRNFEQDHFVDGAKQAYEMVVTAFAAGDRQTLRSLLSDEVYTAFDGVIREREQKKQTVDFTFIGFREVKISHAALKRRTAEITDDLRRAIHVRDPGCGWQGGRRRPQDRARRQRCVDLYPRRALERSQLDHRRHSRRRRLTG